jgi:MFS family permease
MKERIYTPAFFRLSFASLLFFLSFNLVIPELPDMLRSLGGGSYLGWIIPSFSISALVARPLSGWFTDQIGRKFTLIAGCLFCLFAGLLYPLIGAISGFFVVRAIHGFSTGFTPTGFTAYTADIVPKTHRGRAMGWLGIFNNAGTSLGYGLGAWIVLYFGRNYLFFTSAVLAIIALLIFASLPETLPKKLRSERVKPTLKWRQIIFLPAWKPGIIMALVCISLGSILTVMPDYTLSLGFKNKGLYLSWYISFSLIFRLLSGKISDALGRAWSTAIGSGLQIFSMILLIWQVGPYYFHLSAALYGIGQGFNAPSLFAWASDLGGIHHRGKSVSTLFICLELGVIIGGLFGGYLITSWGGAYEHVFELNLLGFVAAFVLSLYFIKEQAKRGSVK